MAALALVTIALLVLAAILAPLLAPYPPDATNVRARRELPSGAHLLGTDELGRDILSRLIYGTRISLTVSLFSISLAMVLGVPLGLMSGYQGGRVDELIMRPLDVLMAFPRILLAILIVAVLGPGLVNMMLAIGIWTIPIFARIVRSNTLALRQGDFVLAAEAIGSRPFRIMFRHVLPNCLGPLLVTASLSIAGAILTESGLSFLGLGVEPGTPSWGMMLSGGRTFLRSAPHIATLPGLAITATVLSFNFLGDGLRDALDPRQKI